MSSLTGHGECSSDTRSCGKWCFVDDDASCFEANPSSNGDPYRWTCEACSAATIQRGIGFLLFGLLGFKIQNHISVSHSVSDTHHQHKNLFYPFAVSFSFSTNLHLIHSVFHKLYQLFDNCHYCYYYVMIIVVMIIVSVLLF